ncbi:hypothetical protein BDQ17DRAFT_613102 [Cyathus striatus]|nr:hypothetical protein BDQ17DRAFT_613102 [Cyathus striatus]
MASSVLEKWEIMKKAELKLNDGSASSDSKDTIKKKKMIVRSIQSTLKMIIKCEDKTSLYSDDSTESLGKSSSTGELELQDIESNGTESAGALVLTTQSSESRSVNHSDKTRLDELAILNIQSTEAEPVPGKSETESPNKAKSSGELKRQGIRSDETESARDSEVQRVVGELELQNVRSSEPRPLVGEVIHRDIHSNEAEPVPGILEV